MSLEQAINDNTAATRELIAILKGGVIAAAPVPAEKAETGKKIAAALKAAAKEPEAAKAPDAPAVDRKAVTDKVIQIGKNKGREAALKLLAKFDAKNVGSVPEEKLPELDKLADAELVAA